MVGKPEVGGIFSFGNKSPMHSSRKIKMLISRFIGSDTPLTTA
jgi:hypothetical protein